MYYLISNFRSAGSSDAGGMNRISCSGRIPHGGPRQRRVQHRAKGPSTANAQGARCPPLCLQGLLCSSDRLTFCRGARSAPWPAGLCPVTNGRTFERWACLASSSSQTAEELDLNPKPLHRDGEHPTDVGRGSRAGARSPRRGSLNPSLRPLGKEARIRSFYFDPSSSPRADLISRGSRWSHSHPPRPGLSQEARRPQLRTATCRRGFLPVLKLLQWPSFALLLFSLNVCRKQKAAWKQQFLGTRGSDGCRTPPSAVFLEGLCLWALHFQTVSPLPVT